jgi:hypothetical protein
MLCYLWKVVGFFCSLEVPEGDLRLNTRIYCIKFLEKNVQMIFFSQILVIKNLDLEQKTPKSLDPEPDKTVRIRKLF